MEEMRGDRRQEPQSRRIRVAARNYAARASKSRFDTEYVYPELRLGGLWLRHMGLDVGDYVEVQSLEDGELLLKRHTSPPGKKVKKLSKRKAPTT